MRRALLGATLSIGIVLSPIMAQAQQTGGAAGAEASTTTGGIAGLSTMTIVGIGTALAAILVVSVTGSNKAVIIDDSVLGVEPTCENGGIADCGIDITGSTSTSTATSTGTG